MSACHDCDGCATAVSPVRGRRPHVVAIIGPPNSGKSTLFRAIAAIWPLLGAIPAELMRAANARAASGNTSADEAARWLDGEIGKK